MRRRISKTGLPGDALLEKQIFLVTMTVTKQVFLKPSTKQVVLVTIFLERKAGEDASGKKGFHSDGACRREGYLGSDVSCKAGFLGEA